MLAKVGRGSRVFLVYKNPLFAYSIRAALRGHVQIQLVGELADWTHAEAEITRLGPDVLIVEEDGREVMDGMLRALSLRSSPRRVVGMRMDEPTMHVWSCASHPIKQAYDLIAALEERPIPAGGMGA